MSGSALYGDFGGATTQTQTRTLFSQTMGLVALTGALFAAGAYVGRNLSYQLGIVWFIAAIACLIAMRFTVRRSANVTTGLLVGFGVLMGLALAPTLAYYAHTDAAALAQSGGATALFIAGFGAAGTRPGVTSHRWPGSVSSR